ncbi:hypothetical protein LPJ79_005916 [Coemansia sp. RSA 1821]|nr:hypothetical protein LPJ68_005959 [Coemansia sp. RSA 1086]KAJ1746319.1 hypothetical protein LPJ79_005916 [Coemansia sp. RSA 1821]
MLSSACYSASQLALHAMPVYRNEMGVRAAIFTSSFSTVFSSFLVAGAIGVDTAVRYGLRSFRLAQRLSGTCEFICFVAAAAVSQPLLYMFDAVAWSGSVVAVDTSAHAFEAAVWMTQTGWVVLSLAVSIALTWYALAKANKMTRYQMHRANASAALVLGSPACIQSRVVVSLCYVLAVFMVSVWKIAFRTSGSSMVWLCYAASICEAIQPILVAGVFAADWVVMTRAEYKAAMLSTLTICQTDVYSSYSKGSFPSRIADSATWNSIGSMKQDLYSTADSSNIQQCHIQSEPGKCYEGSYTRRATMDSNRHCSGLLILYPVASR